MREIIFDTETTGLSPANGDRVIEIGAVELVNHVPTGKVFHHFVKPDDGRSVHPEALAVHGISDEFLADKPSFSEIIEEFLAFFSEGRLIAHNASFDMGFFDAEMTRIGVQPFARDRVLDTLEMARLKYPGARNSLDALCQRYNIDNSHREKHGALLDSELLAEVYIELLGGKQTSLGLSQSGDRNNSDNNQQQSATAIPKRSVELASLLQDDDIKAHKLFLQSFKSRPIWLKPDQDED